MKGTAMLISQLATDAGGVAVLARIAGGAARVVRGAKSVYALANEAAERRILIAEVIEEAGLGESVDLVAAAAAGRLLPPITHPDPAHLHLTGTGLTHLGSASTRNEMHATKTDSDAPVTDSMRMFQWGREGGKPEAGRIGVQPEWFYKGNGNQLVAPGAPLLSPSFALDGGEEPEIAGVYIVDAAGRPCRVGFAVANEFSDHVTEKMNYLYLAHSKLRPASIGPEIRLGPPPEDIRGTSRILRGDAKIFERPFVSGEANMSHSFANLEYHHFKYDLFRVPGDVHIHMFGTATLSFAANLRTKPGDVFEISAEGFGLPLRNTLQITPNHTVSTRVL